MSETTTLNPGATAAQAQAMLWHAPAKAATEAAPQRWPAEAVQQLLDMPFLDLLHRAQAIAGVATEPAFELAGQPERGQRRQNAAGDSFFRRQQG